MAAARRSAPGVLLLLALLVGLAGADAGLLSGRVHRLGTATAPAADPGAWVLVGLDSRADLPAGASPSAFGSPGDVPGARADVVVVLRRTGDGLRALSVPRDVVVRGTRGGRLALSWLAGPGSTVAGLCSLGIPTGHLVSVDLGGFAALVDAAGGIDVDVPAPVRDPYSGLDLPVAGRRHLDGTTALALVRSRHPEHLSGGRWVPAPVDPDGRAAAAGTVLQALAAAVRADRARPWRLQGVAWAASGALGLDDGTSPAALAGLLGHPLRSAAVLPVGPPVGSTPARFPTASTRAAVRAAGLSCGG